MPKNSLTVIHNVEFKPKEGIEAGEGVTGQSWQEGNMVYLKALPADYVKITSGLGDANPRSILVVPLKVNGNVYGVIEILL